LGPTAESSKLSGIGVAAATPDIVGPDGAEVRSGCTWRVQLVYLGSGEVLFAAPAGAIMDVGHGAAYGVLCVTLMDVGPRRGVSVGTRIFNADSEATATRWAQFSNTVVLTWDTVPSAPGTFTYDAGRVAQGDWREIDNLLVAESTTARTGSPAPITVPLNLAVDLDLGSLAFVLSFDPALLRAVSYRADGRTTAAAQPDGIDQAGGRIVFSLGHAGGETVIAAGSGLVAEAIFELQPSVNTAVTAWLTLGSVQAATTAGASKALGARNARVEVADSSTHTLTYLPGDNGSIVGPTPQTVGHGADGIAVTAVPAFGYHFVAWSDGSTANPRQDTAVTADQTLTAAFLAAGAVPPHGAFLARVAAPDSAARGLWDLTGAYAGQALTLALVHDPTGKLSGTAIYTVAKDTAVTMPVKGTVKGSRGSITMKGTLKGADPARTVSVALALSLTVDSAHRQLVGRLTGSSKANGTTTPVDEALTLAIPAPMDGTWTLRLQLAPAGRAVTGTAELTLSNLVRHTFVVGGRSVGETAILSLMGSPADPAFRAVKIKATLTPLEGGWARLESGSGRGYGQALGW
jgi:hypothetical protein